MQEIDAAEELTIETIDEWVAVESLSYGEFGGDILTWPEIAGLSAGFLVGIFVILVSLSVFEATHLCRRIINIFVRNSWMAAVGITSYT
ncbi:MAG: hypothetical protein AAF226_10855, partial [Verrucomicrobiota bacterium]